MAVSTTSARRAVAPASGVVGRRSARLIPAGSPQWVLLTLLVDTLDPAWTPESAAEHLLGRARNVQVLRIARKRLRDAGRDRTTVLQARALATLTVAIKQLDDSALAPPHVVEVSSG